VESSPLPHRGGGVLTPSAKSGSKWQDKFPEASDHLVASQLSGIVIWPRPFVSLGKALTGCRYLWVARLVA